MCTSIQHETVAKEFNVACINSIYLHFIVWAVSARCGDVYLLLSETHNYCEMQRASAKLSVFDSSNKE